MHRFPHQMSVKIKQVPFIQRALTRDCLVTIPTSLP
jgi:hypothetical protein